MRSREGINRVLERFGDLPAMPEVVAEVLRVTDDPESDMAEASEVIQRDPALTAKILRVSNSPYYGMKQFVGTLKLAMVILGVREIRNIVLGVSLFDTLRNDRTEAILAQDFWTRSFQVGSLAKSFSKEMRLAFQGEDFIAGLLHDIGKMVLIRQIGVPFINILKEKGTGASLFVAELETYGFTHADAAAALATRWNLPQTLCDALKLHHPMDGLFLEDAKDPNLAAVVRIGYLTANSVAGADGNEGIRNAISDTDAWAVLNSAPAPLPENVRETFLVELVEKLNESPSWSL